MDFVLENKNINIELKDEETDETQYFTLKTN